MIKDLRRRDHIFKRPRLQRGWSEIRFGKRDARKCVRKMFDWKIIDRLL